MCLLTLFFRRLAAGVAFVLIALCLPSFLQADQDITELPLLSPAFGEHMVLQRGKPGRFWGWEKPGQQVSVSLAGRTESVVTGADGRWQAQLAMPPAGGPYALKVQGHTLVEFHDILVGDVWLCGGQSNMEFGLSRSTGGPEEVQKAEHPQLRYFKVASHSSYSESIQPTGTWAVCSPSALQAPGGDLSAVAYYFGVRLQRELGVPIGLIQCCLGGTPAETWMAPRTLEGLSDFAAAMAELGRLRAAKGAQYGNYIMHWYDQYDVGLKGKGWASLDFDDAAWKTVTLPGGFAELGVPDQPAVCWFRRELVLPDPLPAGDAKLRLGIVEKMDTAHINGKWVGASSWVENPRVYTLSAGVLKPGKNLIAIRVLKLKPDGGFQSPADALSLELGDGKVIPLAGNWRGAMSVDARAPHPLPLGYENYPIIPSVLYQGMLKPLAPLSLKGALWYQGEANTSRARQYRTLLPLLIADWRALFQDAEMPFYIVSLPAFMKRRAEPGEDSWAELREAQALTVASVPHTGLAVAVDTGEADDIHPKEKRGVAERLALCALHDTYGRDLVCRGPRFLRCEVEGPTLRIHFSNTTGGLVAKGVVLGEFSVAGADGRWHWAEARIEGDSVVLSCSEVPKPVHARYAWQSNPLATLYNGAGLPAEPFRTDEAR